MLLRVSNIQFEFAVRTRARISDLIAELSALSVYLWRLFFFDPVVEPKLPLTLPTPRASGMTLPNAWIIAGFGMKRCFYDLLASLLALA